MSDSLRPHGLQPTRLLRPWDFPGKSTGVGCHCLLLLIFSHRYLWRIDAFELWCWRSLLRVPWTARRSNQSILKEISPKYSLGGLMLKLKLQYFSHLMWKTDSLEKTLMLGNIEYVEKGTVWDEMVGWHHWLDGHEFEQVLGVGKGQGNLACQGVPRVRQNWATELNWSIVDWTAFFLNSCDLNWNKGFGSF